ncbi:MAG: sugar phosphate isomerase/epimerase, partial [Chloroflexota bacterium]|nr:sugar phosphate isomerase/epimerase [Chloroflexota bacterium]
MSQPRLGISTAAFFPWDLEKMGYLLRSQPLTHVELMPQAPQECAPSFSKTLRRFLGLSLQVSSIHFPLALHHFLSIPYPTARLYARRLCRNLAELAGELGALTIVTHSAPKGMMGADFQSVTRENIGYLADRCQRHGVMVALENTPEGAAQTAEHLQTWLKAINCRNLGTCLDVGHAHRSGLDPATMVRDMPNLVHVHVHGFRPDLGDHRTLQEGIVDWATLGTQLRQRCYEGGVVIELKPETLGQHPAETLRENATFLLQSFGPPPPSTAPTGDARP